MKRVDLPNGEVATIFTKGEISERTNRLISRAFMSAQGVAAKLARNGFADDDMTTWDAYDTLTNAEKDILSDYQTVLIKAMLKSWSLDAEITDNNIVDLPKGVYELLSAACQDAWVNDEEDFSPDGVTDPKVDTAV
jgi:hypothetical protein